MTASHLGPRHFDITLYFKLTYSATLSDCFLAISRWTLLFGAAWSSTSTMLQTARMASTTASAVSTFGLGMETPTLNLVWEAWWSWILNP